MFVHTREGSFTHKQSKSERCSQSKVRSVAVCGMTSSLSVCLFVFVSFLGEHGPHSRFEYSAQTPKGKGQALYFFLLFLVVLSDVN